MDKGIEILAPCGGPEHLRAAVYAGADAVYLGVPGFSARRNAVNFKAAELREAVRFCHGFGVRVYAALNILVRDAELPEVQGLLSELAGTGPDALIVQDIGLARLIRSVLPDMPLHASTQLSVHSPEGVRFCASEGFNRVVIARECDRKTLAAITADAPCGVEVFVHGALCVSVSGQCTLSAMIGGRSGNRGLCAQPCRLDFSGAEPYALSLKDLCLVQELPELARMGVQSVKIEGRMKRPEYVAAAVTACRSALEGREPDLESLRAVFSRQGFTQGYYTGTHTHMRGTRTAEDARDSAAILPKLTALYDKPVRRVSTNMFLSLEAGAPASLRIADCVSTITVTGPVPEPARTRPTTPEDVSRLLSRLGDTPFELGQLDIRMDGDLMLPAAHINAMRREAADRLLETRIRQRTPVYTIHEATETAVSEAPAYPYPLRIHCRTEEQATAILETVEAAEVALPLRAWEAIPNAYTRRILVEAPRFVSDEDALRRSLAMLRDRGFVRLLCQNPAHVTLGHALGFELHGGFGLNVFNSPSAVAWDEWGLASLTASFELKTSDIRAIRSPVPLGIIAYGRLPLMLLRRCPFDQDSRACRNCPGTLIDRTGRRFPVQCHGDHRELLNADTLWLADRLDKLPGAFFSLLLHNEAPGEAFTVARAYLEGGEPPPGYTRGLYWRGVD